MEIRNGDIIRLSSDETRDWVAIHYTKCEKEKQRFNRNIKDNTGYYLFGGLWYNGNALTSEPYGKCAGMLKRGMFAHITIVGNISNPTDYRRYIANEKV